MSNKSHTIKILSEQGFNCSINKEEDTIILVDPPLHDDHTHIEVIEVCYFAHLYIIFIKIDEEYHGMLIHNNFSCTIPNYDQKLRSYYIFTKGVGIVLDDGTHKSGGTVLLDQNIVRVLVFVFGRGYDTEYRFGVRIWFKEEENQKEYIKNGYTEVIDHRNSLNFIQVDYPTPEKAIEEMCRLRDNGTNIKG